MRVLLALVLLTLLAACSGDPRSFGITGPGPVPAQVVTPPADEPDAAPTPGVPTGSSYGPSNQPSTGSSGFWGYN